MTTEKKFSGGCLNCSFETTDRAELNLHLCNPPMATVADVLGEIETTAPKDWLISLEYPNFIAVSHPTFNDEQMIALGDINGFFSFNDGIANPVAGDMAHLWDAKEIAIYFWKEISAIYPDLVKGE